MPYFACNWCRTSQRLEEDSYKIELTHTLEYCVFFISKEMYLVVAQHLTMRQIWKTTMEHATFYNLKTRLTPKLAWTLTDVLKCLIHIWPRAVFCMYWIEELASCPRWNISVIVVYWVQDRHNKSYLQKISKNSMTFDDKWGKMELVV